jgi:hypothetical protein
MYGNYVGVWKVFGGRYLFHGDVSKFDSRGDKNLHGPYAG